MRKFILGAVALASAGTSQAAVQISFNSGPPGNVGSNTHVYTGGGYSVTASGYSNFNFTTNTGTANNLFDKNGGGDENGVGLVGDPSGDDEIWYAGNNFQTIPAIVLNVSSLLSAGATGGQFEMGSTTSNEQWRLYGYNGTLWSLLTTGTAESTFVNFTGWGSYSRYAFASGGTVVGDQRTAGNVLLTALSFTALPEPGTWALMLLGFGAIGISVRRKAAQAAIGIA